MTHPDDNNTTNMNGATADSATANSATANSANMNSANTDSANTDSANANSANTVKGNAEKGNADGANAVFAENSCRPVSAGDDSPPVEVTSLPPVLRTSASRTSSGGVDKSGGRIRSMFAEISPRYDLLNHVLSGGTDYFWRRKTVRTIPPTNDAPILDVCTGTGDLAVAYWKKAKGHAPVIGTDFTHEMVRLAEKKSRRVTTKKTGRAPLSFLEADTLQLPFSDNWFQIVCVAFGLRNVADPQCGLREMTRVCRPGGSVVVLEFSLPRSRMIGRLYRWYFRRILPRLGQWLSGNNHAAYRYLPESVSEFPQGEELAALLQKSGLIEVTWKPLTCGVATLYFGKKPN